MQQFNQHNTAIQSQILISDVTSCKSHFLSSEATKEVKEGQTVLRKYAHKNCVYVRACIRIKSCSKSSFYFTVLFQLVCLWPGNWSHRCLALKGFCSSYKCKFWVKKKRLSRGAMGKDAQEQRPFVGPVMYIQYVTNSWIANTMRTGLYKVFLCIHKLWLLQLHLDKMWHLHIFLILFLIYVPYAGQRSL